MPVHPRGCGERDSGHQCITDDDGSSPRVRGTRVQIRSCVRLLRFIPAGAGNASSSSPYSSSSAVHPRGCGERAIGGIDRHTEDGSSPRVRGTPLPNKHTADRRRFIPAGAGNALKMSCATCLSTVHPRGCGERRSKLIDLGVVAGSSPRVRGTLAGA
ncbi:hypothetical protein [Methylomonas fluvii]|nr:hypothetical protein [Methylomonas fluvii]